MFFISEGLTMYEVHSFFAVFYSMDAGKTTEVEVIPNATNTALHVKLTPKKGFFELLETSFLNGLLRRWNDNFSRISH
jgi:hypothetical protein